jgi:hypothetical protein
MRAENTLMVSASAPASRTEIGVVYFAGVVQSDGEVRAAQARITVHVHRA